MLKFNHQDRFDATQCLDHDFFIDFKTLINKTRHDFDDYAKNTFILYPVCQERQWMEQTATCLFNNQKKLEWYNHRCLFQAVDMYSRYLYAMDADKQQIHNEFDSNLLFMSCIYICIKYFSSIHYPISFSEIVQEEYLTTTCLKMVEQFEGGLIKNCFAFDVYHETLYEAADYYNDKLTDDDIKNLLYMFTHNNHLCHLTTYDVYTHYRLSDKTNETLLSPL